MALCVTFAFGTAYAGEPCDPKDPKCEPPKKERICTIGWYKNYDNPNHDNWYDRCVLADGSATCDALLADLDATGQYAGDTKNAAADYIVANYVGFGNELCEAATGYDD
jgi:hypothetical protein